ncbi:Small glutamine-rich tetratricopeptide repeat-containing protein 2 [Coemansia sp. RSA 1797]|nr:Small glutamine-rich tetratricopeptide repeat-containing protein 2 [Coemansia sp. RSA 454]KAJ2272139.1 Small glutamine-rich tetratricopeptide repeat-containing protein 2 [Coemansia sp. RSA 371]KAJ2593340.1 Small glutamine-rich tetratricopeptide repeat-containing protein 2 [Coemansia sp. RSA 1797]
MQTPEESRKRLAMAIIEYLDKAVADSLISTDGAESLEIAKQCISDAFELDLEDDAETKALSLKPFSLDKVFDVYMATQAKLESSNNTAGSSTDKAPVDATPTTNTASGPSDEDRMRADAFKAEGNSFVTQKNYKNAIDAYTRAIDLVSDTAVYYGNRAAAYSQNGEYEKAVADAKQALKIDPSYSKGYSRLGLAHYGLGQYKEAADAYTDGLALDPGNKGMLESLESAKSKLDASSVSDRAASPASPAAQSAAGSGGGFDLASLMSNPALMNMAQSMMANGGLESLMSNPSVSRMAENFRNTGQTPSMADMMNNPELMDMARNMSGSAGSTGNAGATDSGANSGSSGAGSIPLASLMNNPALMNMARQFMQGNNGGSGSQQ